MTETNGNGDKRHTITIPTPWGKVEIRGISSVLSIILALLSVMVYGGWDHIQDTQARRGVAQAEHKSITGEVQQVEERLTEVIYVLSLSQEERTKLKLEMPDSLRRRAR